MANLFKAFSILTILAVSQSALAADMVPIQARYTATLPADPHPKLVKSVKIVVCSAPGREELYWYEITCLKVSGDSLKLWLLTDGHPFAGSSAKKVNFLRYIVQEAGQSPIEYVNIRSGKALLPMFGLAEKLLPRATGDSEGLLFNKGTFLGHPLVHVPTFGKPYVALPKGIRKLFFNPDLLIGTSRNFRDDGKGRKSEKDNYNYIPFTKENYDEMITAGINYFTAKGEQIDWIKRRAVFCEGYSPGIDFPEELFRPNFRGLRMFIDEPASRLAGKYERDGSPADAVKVIQTEIRRKLNNRGYESILRKSGIDLGSLELPEPDVPIWETYIGTAYYQLEANPCGIIQECRWQIRPGNFDRGRMLQRINAEFGTNIPVEPENLFLWYYSQMIGPARVFGAKWGMSIYGHAEQELRLPSMKLAYDLGAAYIWFWTSDHNHHVPYTEQLALTRAITDYAKRHPRPALSKLMARAKKAIVLPYGYTLPACWELDMYGSYIFSIDRKNELEIPYKQVLAPAVREIEYCLKNKIPYDVIPAGEDFDPSIYEEIVWVKEDKTLIRQAPPRP
ncbi:MAG: hypothetical protein ISS79_06480 [Phycisphaerae bacterium]|nr:hypothetical protein [Phycisphaerae bacterium]